MHRRAAGLAVLAAGLTTALADVLGRAAGWGALGAGLRDSDRVALTFDDGPSARTPELLAVLERHAARATFFVTAPACAAHPEGLQALMDAGHQVEAHGRWHRHALALTPGQEWAQVRWHPRAGQGRGLLYRPPYGGHSPLTRVLAALAGRQVALWDVEGRDWTPAPASGLAASVLAQVRPGSVLLLHDGPAVTPELLERVLVGLRARGLHPVRLAELPPRRISWRQGLGRLRTSFGLRPRS
jgi:peptidoglycan/xylan/chitin deacetylase (PgdA/CDA1 family)